MSQANRERFTETVQSGYTSKGPSIILGGAMVEGEPVQNLQVKIPLKSLNRHGLIAGATGTGKTKSLQVFVEQLSKAGVPSIVMDMKGDLSGLARPGATNKHVEFRTKAIGIDYQPQGFPVELLSLRNSKGADLRATISEFGPVLLSRMLDLNDTQTGVLAVLFKYSDDHRLPLLNLADLKEFLRYALNEGAGEIKAEYGQISPASINTILRKLVALEQQGADLFFGEPSFDIDDLMYVDEKGEGRVSIVRLMDIQDKPELFSTFMLCLLCEVYGKLPEIGDPEKPKLLFFIDEAHLLFRNASKALLDQVEVIIKLIRSKGVGIYFISQSPTDVPESILGQCGLKIQHALRAFTAKDRKDIKSISQNFPESEFYNVPELITQLGVGEAFITALNEKGIPTPLVHTLMRPPLSRMDVLEEKEVDEVLAHSRLFPKYDREIDRESAEEILKAKLTAAEAKAGKEEKLKEELNSVQSRRTTSSREPDNWIEEMSKNTMVRQVGRTIFRELTRGILGVLGAK